MSLINDALKRAKHTQHARATAAAGELPLQPTEALRSADGVPWTLFLAVSAAALILGGGLLWQLRSHGQQATAHGEPQAGLVSPSTAPSPSVEVAETAATPPAEASPAETVGEPPAESVAPVAPLPGEAASAPLAEPAGVAASIADTEPATPVVEEPPVAPPEPAFPALKLQGIFYSRTKPSALINGQTLFVGEQVEGATVRRIDALQVEVEFDGVTRTLSLR